MKVLESTIEHACIRAAKKLGVSTAIKLNLRGRRSWPDRMFIGDGFIWFVEFKRPGNVPTAGQAAVHRLLKKLRQDIEVHDDVQKFKRALVSRVQRARARANLAA